MAASGAPVASGFVASLARPAENTTGLRSAAIVDWTSEGEIFGPRVRASGTTWRPGRETARWWSRAGRHA